MILELILGGVVLVETILLVIQRIRANTPDGEIVVSEDYPGKVVWNIKINDTDKITEGNGQIVKFRVVEGLVDG